MNVFFSHGKDSGPTGSKIAALSAIALEEGLTVSSIDYTSIRDPDARVLHLLEILSTEPEEYILVGSSMGGYVSLVAAAHTKPKGVFLMAPALYMPGYQVQDYPVNECRVEVVHGRSDDVIPYQHSARFASKSQSTLHLIDGDHALTTSIDTVGGLFRSFLRETALPRL